MGASGTRQLGRRFSVALPLADVSRWVDQQISGISTRSTCPGAKVEHFRARNGDLSCLDHVLARSVHPLNSGHPETASACPFRATNGLMHRSKQYLYSITLIGDSDQRRRNFYVKPWLS